jgi:hypothetical protein
VVGKRERFFRSIGGYDDEFFRASIDFLYRTLGKVQTALANFVYFDRSFFRAALGVVSHDFRPFVTPCQESLAASAEMSAP